MTRIKAAGKSAAPILSFVFFAFFCGKKFRPISALSGVGVGFFLGADCIQITGKQFKLVRF